MFMDSKLTFTFSPRPEAHPMKWEELLRPVRRAVRDLLLRIDGATEKEGKNKKSKGKEAKNREIAANCFLVHGDRGTGKSTVLLSAKYACESKEKFFEKDEHKEENSACRVRADAMNSAEKLKNVVWLDMLDLEPLPPRANLLTTVLTRVRNALYLPDSEKPLDETTWIFEERADSARNKLKQLINDATLMWEDIQEPDTRSRANRQVAAADIYARFQEQFKDAINTLSRELGRRSGKGDTHSAIILPIDNIDRSTEHLYSIVKLAQMVSCPYFWLVMAGDRQDVETFLERAYWKELIRIGEEGAGATGKTGVSGEDEALVMARRQAAAASHRLLPPSHRVEVGLVEPEATLAFKPPGASGQSGADKNIRELLADVRLITEKEVDEAARKKAGKETDQETEQGRRKIGLIHLFDAQDLIKDVVHQKDNQKDNNLTEAAKLGLRLPARGVLDLWQLAYWVTNDHTIYEHRRAEEIARTMLRNVITESSIPNEIGRRLQEQIIRRNPQGGTMLDFYDPKLGPESALVANRLRSLDFELRLDQQKPISLGKVKEGEPSYEAEARSRLNVIQAEAMDLRLRHPRQRDSYQSSDDMLPVPDLVAAWMTVLHDVLVWGAEDSSVIVGPGIPPSTIVEVKLEVVISNGGKHWIRLERLLNKLTQEQREQLNWPPLFWPMPYWGSFIENDVCGQLWRHFLSHLKDNDKKLLDQADQVDSLPRLLATGWVACALETFLAFQPSKEWVHTRGILGQVMKLISPGADNKPGGMAGAVKDAEVSVMRAAANMYEKIINAKNAKRRGAFLAEEGIISMSIRDWLEQQLPLLQSYLYVPVVDGDAKERAEEIDALLKNTNLAESWETNRHYILADIEACLETLFLPFVTPIINYPKGFESLGQFSDMHRLWPTPENTGD